MQRDTETAPLSHLFHFAQDVPSLLSAGRHTYLPLPHTPFLPFHPEVSRTDTPSVHSIEYSGIFPLYLRHFFLSSSPDNSLYMDPSHYPNPPFYSSLCFVRSLHMDILDFLSDFTFHPSYSCLEILSFLRSYPAPGTETSGSNSLLLAMSIHVLSLQTISPPNSSSFFSLR